jgi:hypothetical protein
VRRRERVKWRSWRVGRQLRYRLVDGLGMREEVKGGRGGEGVEGRWPWGY